MKQWLKWVSKFLKIEPERVYIDKETGIQYPDNLSSMYCKILTSRILLKSSLEWLDLFKIPETKRLQKSITQFLEETNNYTNGLRVSHL